MMLQQKQPTTMTDIPPLEQQFGTADVYFPNDFKGTLPWR